MRAIPLLLLFAGCSSGPASGPPPRTSAPPPPPTATIAVTPTPIAELIPADVMRERLTGETSKPRVYNFWATWCGPCKAELPEIKAFAEAHPEVEVVLVSVDVPKVRDSHVLPYLARTGMDSLASWQLDDPDPSSALLRAVPDWPDIVPVTWIVRPDGTRAKAWSGAIRKDDLEAALAEL